MDDYSASDADTVVEEVEEAETEEVEATPTPEEAVDSEEAVTSVAAADGRLPRIQIQKGAVLVDGQPASAVRGALPGELRLGCAARGG